MCSGVDKETSGSYDVWELHHIFMSYPKQPQELVDEWIKEFTYKAMDGTYLQYNGVRRTDWLSIMKKYGEWCADEQLYDCIEWERVHVDTKFDSALSRVGALYRYCRPPKAKLEVTVNDIQYELTEQQEEQLNQIIKNNASN